MDNAVDRSSKSPSRDREVAGVELFLDTYSNRAKRGFLVCRVPHARKLTDRVTAIPWRAL